MTATDPTNREATASIRGYLYQFDATILAILRLGAQGSLTIEGIEDFDIVHGQDSALYQCKYYSGTEMTDSVVRDAILPMFTGFLSVDLPSQTIRKYHLYGHFKDCHFGDVTKTVDELKKIFIQGKKKKLKNGKYKIEKSDLVAKLGANDSDLQTFSDRFVIHVGQDYDTHKETVKAELQKAFRVTREEADSYHYFSAFSYVCDIAVKPDKAHRSITKAIFMQNVRPSQAVYHSWSIREKGEKEFCQLIRKAHFTQLNIEIVHRFFIVECRDDDTDAVLLKILERLRLNWSSHRIQSKPPKERYAPFVYFRKLAENRLIELKHKLYGDQINFVDGYPYSGATFSLSHLQSPQVHNGCSLRLIHCEADLISTIDGIHGTCEIFDFFVDARTQCLQDSHDRIVAIPVHDIEWISQII
jgi:hypothetical protein